MSAQNGTVDIPLGKALTIDGASVTALRMREPTVEDQLAMDAMTGSDSTKELAMFANLCQQTPDALKKLTLRDYKKVQAAFTGFLV